LAWELARSDLPGQTKLQIIREFDKVLGLDIERGAREYGATDDVEAVVQQREGLRKGQRYQEADGLRNALEGMGYVLQDAPDGTRVRPKTAWERRQEAWPTLSSSAEVESCVSSPDTVDFTIGVVVCNYVADVRRLVNSALKWVGDRSAELIVVDNGSTDGTGEWLEEAAASDPRIKVIHTDHILGEGAAKNILLRQSRGRIVVLLDPSVEVAGDIYTPIEKLLEDESIGVVGPFGLRTDDLHHFHDGRGEYGDMDAMQAYCFAFRRALVREIGFMREAFRFYRNLDLDYSFHFKDKGYRIVADPSLPITRHEHRVWTALAEGERDEMSRKNYRRFLHKWGDRADLLHANQHRD
ncbi:MAG: glycosyltransferase, partial [Chloroflexi bacterium]|nr:glycosyltransferase [Chloroflexota bacterium]